MKSVDASYQGGTSVDNDSYTHVLLTFSNI